MSTRHSYTFHEPEKILEVSIMTTSWNSMCDLNRFLSLNSELKWCCMYSSVCLIEMLPKSTTRKVFMLKYEINPKPTSHNFYLLSLICLCSYVAYIANNIDPHPTAPILQTILTKIRLLLYCKLYGPRSDCSNIANNIDQDQTAPILQTIWTQIRLLQYC